MTPRQVLIVAAAAALATLAGVLVLDAPLAEALHGGLPAWLERTFDDGVHGLDVATGMDLPRGVLTSALIVVGAALWLAPTRPAGTLAARLSAAGHPILVTGLTHAVVRTGGNHLKTLFGRLRPGEALARGDLDHTFFQGGISFPSGHVAHYAALTLAVVLMWPRGRVPALAVLGFVACARVGRDAHFLSDATMSIALAATAVVGFDAALRRARASRGR
ncbi:MAG: phosphatase PAP2 family protein [Kofleriaceae bacterium]|nr:phosphatase PAP2 family protein [Kofleriaceae bacterium]MCB9572693.1 phosphatase PAP2 family protein [Kofleriaceae bacterium]